MERKKTRTLHDLNLLDILLLQLGSWNSCVDLQITVKTDYLSIDLRLISWKAIGTRTTTQERKRLPECKELSFSLWTVPLTQFQNPFGEGGFPSELRSLPVVSNFLCDFAESASQYLYLYPPSRPWDASAWSHWPWETIVAWPVDHHWIIIRLLSYNHQTIRTSFQINIFNFNFNFMIMTSERWEHDHQIWKTNL